MNKIIIAPNSFKECADSVNASRLISNELHHLLNEFSGNYELIQFPISDGGDGFLNCVKFHFGTETRYYKLKSFLTGSAEDYPVEYCPETKTLYIETAKIIGLNLVPAETRNPMNYNSAPMGELLLKINEEKRASLIELDSVVIGIGGTATNDLGIGMLSEFGFKLFDFSNNPLLPLPGNFTRVNRILKPEIGIDFEIQIVTDVENSLLGLNGAVNVFATQKGAVESDLAVLESGFETILNLLDIKGDTIGMLSGAGGGLAAAFQLFFNTAKTNAYDFILNNLRLNTLKNDIKLVITGEGKLDNQTLFNKGAMIIYNYFKEFNIPVCFICGENNLNKIYKSLDVFELKNYFSGIEESIKRFPMGISIVSDEIKSKYLKSILRKV